MNTCYLYFRTPTQFNMPCGKVTYISLKKSLIGHDIKVHFLSDRAKVRQSASEELEEWINLPFKYATIL